MALPFKVKAVYEYSSPHEDDLHFATGQIITVTDEEDDDWYSGEYVDASGVKQEGIFPRNFVEKYEPTAPPRPVRSNRPKKEAEAAPAELPAAVPAPEPEPEPEAEPEELEAEPQPEPAAREPSPPPPAMAAAPAPAPAPKQTESSPPATKPAASAARSAPPPVSEKPTGGSFRDRIAAFNKAAPPVAPFKPAPYGGGGGNSFIKKPFVAPPPSKNAYVPPPREAPVAKIYRRDEDPEISAREAENQEQAEKAGLAPSNDAEGEDQPKPTSLKERIALLQKQQAEQASRHAEAAQKKEKPKRPAKKRTESYGTQETGAEEGEGASLERQTSGEAAPKASIDSVREESEAPRRRKSSKGAAAAPGVAHRMPVTDGNEADMSGAGYTTEEPEEMAPAHDEGEEKPAARGPPSRAPSGPVRQPDVGEEEGTADEPSRDGEDDEEEDEEEEEDDIDPEIRRKEELRARMAKMSGGMGMHGMFGGMPMPGMAPPPKKKKASGSSEGRSAGQAEEAPAARAPPVPMIPLPGMSRVRSPEEDDRQLGDDEEQTPIARPKPESEVPEAEEASSERAAPPIPGGRPAPPPVPKDSRPVPPAPAAIQNPSAGSETDDEMSESTQNLSLATPTADAPRPPPARPTEAPGSPPPPPKRTSTFASEQSTPSSPPQTANKEKRASRVPPPIPGAAPSAPAPAPQTRAPPPPPPSGHLSRASTDSHGPPPKLPPQPPHSTSDDEEDEEVTEYDGDYDTDIASAVPHKDALKAHGRDDSLDDSSANVSSPPSGPPPVPSAPAPRGAPPPLPSQPPPGRASADVPRAAPPPPPPSKAPAPWEDDDNEYDPFRYSGSAGPSYAAPAPKPPPRDDDLYASSPPRTVAPPPGPPPPGPPPPGPPPPGPPQERAVPPPPPHREAAPAPREQAPRDLPPAAAPPRAPPRQSLDVNRGPPRRSTDLSRMSMDSGFVANDVDLGRNTFWWTQPKTLPPAFQNRKDILVEMDESTEGSTVIKDVHVLFQDYSQTVVRAQFDAQDAGNVTLEQRHEAPPARLRQDQLEEAHAQFGRHIHDAVTAKKETVVGDGTPHGLIQELLRPLAGALPPVGTRAYGAVVYGNLANASTQQNDEIRPGDILTLRNARFQGKHGAMHAKYSMEVGKPDHVAVVAEWDGTKKKVRAWEQGRESRKVKLESFKLDDLRSGEVKIWRVMPRSWVGWAGRGN